MSHKGYGYTMIPQSTNESGEGKLRSKTWRFASSLDRAAIQLGKYFLIAYAVSHLPETRVATDKVVKGAETCWAQGLRPCVIGTADSTSKAASNAIKGLGNFVLRDTPTKPSKTFKNGRGYAAKSSPHTCPLN